MHFFKPILVAAAALLLSGPDLAAGNRVFMKSGPFKLSVDRVTSGFWLSFQDKPLVSRGYPASSFLLLSADGKDLFTAQDGLLESTEYGQEEIKAFFRVEDYEVVQILAARKEGILVKNRVRNRSGKKHKVGLCLVLDLARPVEHFSLRTNGLEIFFHKEKKPVFVSAPEDPFLSLGAGDYARFRSGPLEAMPGIAGNSAVVRREARDLDPGQTVSLEIFIGLNPGEWEKKEEQPLPVPEVKSPEPVPVPGPEIQADPLDDLLKEETGTARTN